MFLESLMEVTQFGIKALIITISCSVVLIILFNLLFKMKSQDKAEIEVKDFNKKLKNLADITRQSSLDEKQLKELQKAEKKQKKAELKKNKKSTPATKPRLWVVEFVGDMKASAGENLATEITSILQVATPEDEIVVKIESPGGAVHGYGYAASQLKRVKDKGLKLTTCVDMVAASGGYMMACIGDNIVAAPFAIVGSIGVIAQVPNLHRLLQKHNVDYTEYTAGEFKRTVSIFGENTEKGIEKFKEQLESTHVLFKSWVGQNRPKIEIDKVATGEYWFGQQALEIGLIDKIQTSDSYIIEKAETHLILTVKKAAKKSFQDKISDAMGQTASQTFSRLFSKKISDFVG